MESDFIHRTKMVIVLTGIACGPQINGSHAGRRRCAVLIILLSCVPYYL